MTATQEVKPETVGRKYEFRCYALLSRRIGGDGNWNVRRSYKTLEEAQKSHKESLRGARYQVVGGIAVDFGPDDGERYERKLVKVVKQCEVLEVGVGPA